MIGQPAQMRQQLAGAAVKAPAGYGTDPRFVTPERRAELLAERFMPWPLLRANVRPLIPYKPPKWLLRKEALGERRA